MVGSESQGYVSYIMSSWLEKILAFILYIDGINKKLKTISYFV